MIEFNIKQIVFLTTDIEQLSRIVTAYTVKENSVEYQLFCGTNGSWHYGFEISSSKKEKSEIGLGK